MRTRGIDFFLLNGFLKLAKETHGGKGEEEERRKRWARAVRGRGEEEKGERRGGEERKQTKPEGGV